MHKVVIGLNKPLLITAQIQQYLRIWNVSTITKPQLVREFFSHTDKITSITTVNKDQGTCLVTSKDGFFSIININTAQKMLSEYINCGCLCGQYYAKNNQIFVSTQLYEILGYQIIDGQPPKKFASFKGHIAAVTHITIENNVMISGSADGTIMTWPIPPQKPD